MQKVLLVEDDARLAELTAEYLERYGFHVAVVLRGDLAMAEIERYAPDIVVLDLMLPGMDGLDICRQIRRTSSLPVLMLTARTDLVDQVAGLEVGADDYMLKPVEARLLLAKVRAILRRSGSGGAAPRNEIRFGQLTVDLNARQVYWKGAEIEMKTADYNLFMILLYSAGKVLSRDDILQQWRGIDFDGVSRAVDNCVSRLRRVFDDDPTEPRKIKTIWGRGYLLNPAAWDELC